MSTPCEKHAALPVVGQSPCAGCEIERLMAENEALHAQVDTLAERHASALCEIEALRKDGARYRWLSGQAELQSYGGSDYCLPVVHAWDYKPGAELNEQFSDIDAAIDAAMSKDPLANPGQ
mgnify:CR=1 FL=1